MCVSIGLSVTADTSLVYTGSDPLSDIIDLSVLSMATSYHMEALRRQRIIERAVAARLRIASAQPDTASAKTPLTSLLHSLDNGVGDKVAAKLSQQSKRTATAASSVHGPSTAHTQSRQSERPVSKHSSHQSRPSTAATLTKENLEEDTHTVLSRPGASRGSRPVSAPPNINQQQKPDSNVVSKDVGSRSEQRDGIGGVKSREASKLSQRPVAGVPEKPGSAVSAGKPNSANKPRISSKQTSPIPEETTKDTSTETKSSRPPSVSKSRLSTRTSNKPESQDKQIAS